MLFSISNQINVIEVVCVHVIFTIITTLTILSSNKQDDEGRRNEENLQKVYIMEESYGISKSKIGR